MGEKIKVSLFASSIRPHLYEAMFKSLEGTTVDYEIVFAGDSRMDSHLNKSVGELIITQTMLEYDNFRYIDTANIKPAQCYEVARRACKGEVVIWIADDCELPDDVIGKVYRFYKERCTRKDIISIQTRENYGQWGTCDITCHKFFPTSGGAPKMAPLGMINREYFQELGGIDRRYICGQWDNDLMMRLYGDGGNLYHFSDACIELDHLNKHDPKYGISGDRPFGRGYNHDRVILEGSWGTHGQMKYDEFPNFTRYDKGFEPYESDDKTLAVKSESFNLKEWFSD